jgi:hypothetical protein
MFADGLDVFLADRLGDVGFFDEVDAFVNSLSTPRCPHV